VTKTDKHTDRPCYNGNAAAYLSQLPSRGSNCKRQLARCSRQGSAKQHHQEYVIIIIIIIDIFKVAQTVKTIARTTDYMTITYTKVCMILFAGLAYRNKPLLLWLQTCSGISYSIIHSVAFYFTVPVRPSPKNNSGGGGRTLLLLAPGPPRNLVTPP